MRLTAEGLEIERALLKGYRKTAHSLYVAQIAAGVPMTDDENSAAATAWHRLVRNEIGYEASGSSLRAECERKDLLDGFEPSIVQRTVRNDEGDVVGSEYVSNLDE